jgi:hypothetical protein
MRENGGDLAAGERKRKDERRMGERKKEKKLEELKGDGT